MEWKIRVFIVEVLNFALITKEPEVFNPNVFTQSKQKGIKTKKYQQPSNLPLYRLDGEKGVEYFGQKVQPDLTVQANDSH